MAINSLAPARNTGAIIVAWNDLLKWAPTVPPVIDARAQATFESWLRHMVDPSTRWHKRSLVSTYYHRPNNWGTLAGFSVLAAHVALRQSYELGVDAKVFEGWLGNRQAYDGFEFGGDAWQPDPLHPVAIGPVGSQIFDAVAGEWRPMDGALPDELRRDVGYDFDLDPEPFYWPPPEQNYCWGAMQGAVMEAIVLHRLGYDVWNWESLALKRVADWMHTYPDIDPTDADPPGFPVAGDDEQITHVLNYYYASVLPQPYPAPVPANAMKNFIGLDWLY
jgi:hypothetical protein